MMSQTVALQMERLRRHHQAATLAYDPVTLLDLSHALRIWSEMGKELATRYPKTVTTRQFRNTTPPKKVAQWAKGNQSVIAYFPGSVDTYAAAGRIAAMTPAANVDGTFALFISLKESSNGQTSVQRYCFVKDAVYNREFELALSSNSEVPCNYQQWLGGEAVRLSFLADSGSVREERIDRKTLIERVANTLDGSHPSINGRIAGQKYDAPVHHLLEYEVLGLPLPYLLLLKIAQDILSILPKQLGLSQ